MFWGFLYWKFHKKFPLKTWRGPHHFLVEPAVSFQEWLGISTLRKPLQNNRQLSGGVLKRPWVVGCYGFFFG